MKNASSGLTHIISKVADGVDEPEAKRFKPPASHEYLYKQVANGVNVVLQPPSKKRNHDIAQFIRKSFDSAVEPDEKKDFNTYVQAIQDKRSSQRQSLIEQ